MQLGFSLLVIKWVRLRRPTPSPWGFWFSQLFLIVTPNNERGREVHLKGNTPIGAGVVTCHQETHMHICPLLYNKNKTHTYICSLRGLQPSSSYCNLTVFDGRLCQSECFIEDSVVRASPFLLQSITYMQYWPIEWVFT